MEYVFQPSFELKEFFEKNRNNFEETLLEEAVNVREKIDEILMIGNIDLVNNAHKIIVNIIDQEDEALKTFARQEGIAWATHSIELSFKLEWIQAIRRSLWKLIRVFYNLKDNNNMENFFLLEEAVNNRVDNFLNSFFISYSTYKDALIKRQRELVENLSVPIIPINSSVSILPLIGSMDSTRISVIEEKVLTEIGESRIQTLIMDLSGVAEMEDAIINDLMRLMDGTSMMGCETVITGLRKEVARNITQSGNSFRKNTKTLGTLQQALCAYL